MTEDHNNNCVSKRNGPCNCADLEMVRVCTDCHAAVEEKWAGDEGVTVCGGCGNVEQGVEEWTLAEFERDGYQV